MVKSQRPNYLSSKSVRGWWTCLMQIWTQKGALSIVLAVKPSLKRSLYMKRWLAWPRWLALRQINLSRRRKMRKYSISQSMSDSNILLNTALSWSLDARLKALLLGIRWRLHLYSKFQSLQITSFMKLTSAYSGCLRSICLRSPPGATETWRLTSWWMAKFRLWCFLQSTKSQGSSPY